MHCRQYFFTIIRNPYCRRSTHADRKKKKYIYIYIYIYIYLVIYILLSNGKQNNTTVSSYICALREGNNSRFALLKLRSVLRLLQGDFAGFPKFCEAQIFDFQTNIFYK